LPILLVGPAGILVPFALGALTTVKFIPAGRRPTVITLTLQNAKETTTYETEEFDDQA
jgi:hypothetical protein